MYRLDREDFLKTPYIFLWAVLGFQAGFINSFGFLACGRYVSHVTGFGTQIGMALGEHQVFMALQLLGFPLSFIFGSFFSAIFTSARIERGLRPHYDWITLFIPLCIATVGILGWYGLFGEFGELLLHWRDFILLFSLSFACGVQNGCFATMTKGQIRTTHLTGISTDIGTDFAKMFFGKLSPNEMFLVKRANTARIATFLSFAFGSIVSIKTTQNFHYGALMVPFMTSVIVCASVAQVSTILDQIYGMKKTKSVERQGSEVFLKTILRR